MHRNVLYVLFLGRSLGRKRENQIITTHQQQNQKKKDYMAILGRTKKQFKAWCGHSKMMLPCQAVAKGHSSWSFLHPA
jgi:hypothetical protein